MNKSVEEDHCVDISANGNRDLPSTLATHGLWLQYKLSKVGKWSMLVIVFERCWEAFKIANVAVFDSILFLVSSHRYTEGLFWIRVYGAHACTSIPACLPVGYHLSSSYLADVLGFVCRAYFSVSFPFLLTSTTSTTQYKFVRFAAPGALWNSNLLVVHRCFWLVPSWELTYPLPKVLLKMILLPRSDMLVPWRVLWCGFRPPLSCCSFLMVKSKGLQETTGPWQ